MADLAMSSARPGAPDMRMPGKVTADMLAVPVDMIIDGLPTMMAMETMEAETARRSISTSGDIQASTVSSD